MTGPEIHRTVAELLAERPAGFYVSPAGFVAELGLEPLLSQQSAAEILGVHPDTLRVWHNAGKGPAAIRTAGGERRYHPHDLRRWIAENRDQGGLVTSLAARR